MTRFTTVLLMALLLCSVVVLANPPVTPPQLPPDLPPAPVTSTAYAVTLIAPTAGSTINATTTISYNHTAPTTMTCTLFVSGISPLTANVQTRRDDILSLANGSHTMSVTCANATIVFNSSTISFTVVNQTVQGPPQEPTGAAVTLLYPLMNDSPTLNVTYYHNSTTSTCVVYEGGYALNTRPVPPMQLQTLTFGVQYDFGTYDFKVTCFNGTWSNTVTRTVTVMNFTNLSVYGGLSILPSSLYPGGNVSINGTFTPRNVVSVAVIPPSGPYVTWNVSLNSSGILRTTYAVGATAPLGVYVVSTLDESDVLKNGTFTVLARNPTLLVENNKTNVSKGLAFYVYGTQFLSMDNTTLVLTGGGYTVSNRTLTAADGSFAFRYPATLNVGSYTLNARSSDGQVVKTVSFAIVGASANTTGNTTPPVNTTPPLNNTWVPQNTTNQSGGEEPPVNGGDEPPVIEPTPTPIDEPNTLPEPEQPSSTGLSWWVFVIIFVVLVGGMVGYFIYNGTLDVSSFEAFKDSVTGLLSGTHPGGAGGAHAGSGAGAPIDAADAQTIKSFIYGERGKGFDDLTIRGALLARGWDKNEVDRVFDELYKNG